MSALIIEEMFDNDSARATPLWMVIECDSCDALVIHDAFQVLEKRCKDFQDKISEVRAGGGTAKWLTGCVELGDLKSGCVWLDRAC